MPRHRIHRKTECLILSQGGYKAPAGEAIADSLLRSRLARYIHCSSCSSPCLHSSFATMFDGASKETSASRRNFLKAVAAISGGLVALPFIPSGGFLIPPNPFKVTRQKIANVNEVLENSSMIFWYPSQADPEFTNLLIHLSPQKAKELGKQFIAYNRTCIHLRCLVSYIPGREILGCPCHGSQYRISDGWPIAGPASLIGRFIPSVQLEIDQKGDIYATGIKGEIGYGIEP